MKELTAPAQTAIDTAKEVIVMKSGLTFWVSKETADRASAHIVSQQAHSFLKLAELGQTINTAEIEGIYSPEHYDELQRAKAGEFKCQWGKWHGKRQVCECKEEADREHRRKMKQTENESKPQTPAEKERTMRIIEENRKILEEKGIIKGHTKTGYVLKRSALNAYKARHGNAYKIPEGATIEEDTEALQEAVSTF